MFFAAFIVKINVYILQIYVTKSIVALFTFRIVFQFQN